MIVHDSLGALFIQALDVALRYVCTILLMQLTFRLPCLYEYEMYNS